MALTLSAVLVNAMLDTGSLKSLTDGFLIDIYSGSRPATPDLAASGTKLVTLSLNGAGTPLAWEAVAGDGILNKPPAAVWQGTVAATGVAGYYRLYKSTDTPGNTDASKYRIDGTIGTSGADMNIASTTLTAGLPQAITQFDISLGG